MNGRPRIAVTREGRYYLCVLAFIVGGAVLREVNLLVVLAALMIGPLLFSWRAAVMTLRRLAFHRRLPARISAGDSITVSVVVENFRRRLPSWALVVADRLENLSQTAAPTAAGPSGSAENASTVEMLIPCVPAGGEGRADYRLTIDRRGRYRFGPATVSTGFPFGFLRGQVEFDVQDELLVCPRIGRLTRAWRDRIESSQTGQQRSQHRRGPSEGDYYGLREWRPGDSPRWVHWRTTAKLNTLSVLQFEELRHRDLALVVDLWEPPEATAEQAAAVELAISFAATAAVELGRRGGSQLAVAIAGESLELHSAAASRVFAQELLDRLAVVRSSARADASAAVDAVAPFARRGAKLLIISTRGVERAGVAARPASLQPAVDRRAGDAYEWFDVLDERCRHYFELEPLGP